MTSPSALVQELLQRLQADWWESDTHFPRLGPSYTPSQQAAREKHLERFLEALTVEMERPPRSKAERQSTQERILAAFVTLARSALDFEDCHLDILTRRGMMPVATAFAQAARRFDPAISGDDIFQATRNVWTMNSVQILLGLPAELTPAVFAYSMLYPYSDNYLDNPGISAQTKAGFNQRFARWLVGEDMPPDNAHERVIHDLVRTIETQYDRSQHPQVFESLLAIHRAQCRSVQLLHGDAAPYEVDVLAIGLEKGGTSVLADGYLVGTTLSMDQAAFLFGWGALLQLADDLQDVREDGQAGLLTIFSHTAGRWSLDRLTNRTFHFGFKVLEGLDCFDAPGIEPLKDLIRRSGLLLLVDAAGQAGRFYSKDYVRALEPHSPFRFSFLHKCRKKLARQQVSMSRLIEAFAVADDEEASV